TIADRMSRSEHFKRVAIRGGVITEAAIAGPFVITGKQLRGSQTFQEKAAGGEQGGTEKVTPRDRGVHSQCTIGVFGIRQSRSLGLFVLAKLTAACPEDVCSSRKIHSESSNW